MELANVWGFLIAACSMVPLTIQALATYRKIKQNSEQIAEVTKQVDSVHTLVNGNLTEMRRRADYLTYRLSHYEHVPLEYRSVFDYEGDFEPRRRHRGRSDASGPSGEQGWDDGPV